MGFRINKIPGAVYEPSAIRRKAEDQAAGNGKHRQDEQPPKDERDERHGHHATFAEVQQAVDLEAKKLTDSGQDIDVEAVEADGQTKVRVTAKDGHLIREMSGDEFMQLQKASKDDTQARGRVLDQKF